MEHKTDQPELTWGSSAEEGAKLEAMWPTDETGARDKAVFLTHVPDFNNEADFAVNMLIAYGIPAFKTYNNEGSLGKLIIGRTVSLSVLPPWPRYCLAKERFAPVYGHSAPAWGGLDIK